MNKKGLSDIISNALIILLVLVPVGILWLLFFSYTGNNPAYDDRICEHLKAELDGNITNYPGIFEDMSILGINLKPNKISLQSGKYLTQTEDNVYCKITYTTCWTIRGENKTESSFCQEYYNPNSTISISDYRAWAEDKKIL